MRGIRLLNRAISPTFLLLYPAHSRFHQMYFPHGGLGLYCRFHALVHVHVHVCFHVRVHVRVHVCFHVCVHVCVRVHVRIYKNVPLQLKEGSIVSKEKEGGK
jgi:hypothetical protein